MRVELRLLSTEKLEFAFIWTGIKWEVQDDLAPAEVAKRMARVHTIQLMNADDFLLKVPCIASPLSLFSGYPYQSGQQICGHSLEKDDMDDSKFDGFTFAFFVRTLARQSERGAMMVFRPTIISERNTPNPDPIFRCSWISPEADGLGMKDFPLKGDGLKEQFAKEFKKIKKNPVDKPVEPNFLERFGKFQASTPGGLAFDLDSESSELVVEHTCTLDVPVSARDFQDFATRIPDYVRLSGAITIRQRSSNYNWILEFENKKEAPVSLPLQKLGQQHFSPIVRSVKLLDGERCLSALPTNFSGDVQGLVQARWNVSWSSDPGVELRGSRVVSKPIDYGQLALRAENVRFLPSAGGSVSADMEAWRDLEGEPAEIKLSLAGSSVDFGEERCLLFGAKLQYRSLRQSFTLGELCQRVCVKEPGTEDLSHFCCWIESASGDEAPRVKTDLTILLAEVDPSGDVGEPDTGSEQDRDWHSIVFERQPKQFNDDAKARFALKIRENVTSLKPHEVFVNLFIRALADQDQERRMVVLQRRPLRIAQVRFRSDLQLAISGQSLEIGAYDHRDGSWRLFPEMGQFTLELPSQGVAEEVIKDKNITDEQTSKVLFAPNPQLQLRNQYFEQRLGFAPWQLTKLLGRAGDRDPGSELLSGRVELFLGLQAKFKGGDLRLCELEASLGRLALLLRKSPDHVERRWEQIRGLYGSRLSLVGLRRAEVLELGQPIEQAGESPPILHYTIRTSPKAARSDETTRRAQFIRAGLRHCLPSESVYITLQAPGVVSSSARLESLFLSALGGWGEQSVSFDKEGVKLATQGSMGRTHFVQVEVFGRVSLGWNLAKHVTIYERQVVPSSQFKDEQAPHVGAAWVRKTTEYVEIIELSSQLSDTGQPMLSGPVKSLEFSQSSRIIPVTSAWLQQLGDDVGYAIPLWQPGSDSALYPKPQISMALAAVGGASSRAQLEEPHKFYFFRSDKDIREGRYSPKNWRPFPLFDYGDYVQTPPPWQEAPPSQPKDAAFHFQLSPSDRAVNVLEGRVDKECVAEIQSLVMHRPHPGQPVPASDSFQDLLNCHKERLRDARGFFARVKAFLEDTNKFDGLVKSLTGERLRALKLLDAKTRDGVELTLSEWRGLWMTLPGLQLDEKSWVTSCQELWQPLYEQTRRLLEPKKSHLIESLEKIDSSPTGGRVDWEILISPTLTDLVQVMLQRWLTELQALHLPTSKLYAGLGVPLANLRKNTLLKVVKLSRQLAGLVDYSATAAADLRKHLGELTEKPGLLISDGMATEETQIANFLKSLTDVVQNGIALPNVGWAFAPKVAGLEADETSLETMLNELGMLEEDPLFVEFCRTIREFCKDTMFPDFGKAVGLEYTDLTKAAGKFVEELSNNAVVMPRLLRLTGKPPEVPNLRFESPGLPGRLPELNYYFQSINQGNLRNPLTLPEVRLDPIFSKVDFPDFPNPSPFKLDMPVLSLGRELLPPREFFPPLPPNVPLSLEAAFGNIDLRSLLPKIAGLELADLFPKLDLKKLKLLDPVTLPKNIEVRHGLDRESRRGWLEVKIKFDYSDPTPIFESDIASLTLEQTQFRAISRMEINAQGQSSLRAEGSIRANWKLEVINQPFVVFRDTALEFSQDGKLRYQLDPKKLEFPGALSFLADLAKSFKPPGPASGLTFQITPQGAYSLLNLPIPSLAAGPFGLSHLNLGVRFGLEFSQGLTISSQFNISRREAPFTLVICALGGSGWLEVEVGYATSQDKLSYRVSLGLGAAAAMAFSFGPVSGGIYARFNVSVELRAGDGQNKPLAVSLFLHIHGCLDFCGVVSADISVMLSATYRPDAGELACRGEISVSVDISCFWTFEWEDDVEFVLDAPKFDTIPGDVEAHDRSLE